MRSLRGVRIDPSIVDLSIVDPAGVLGDDESAGVGVVVVVEGVLVEGIDGVVGVDDGEVVEGEFVEGIAGDVGVDGVVGCCWVIGGVTGLSGVVVGVVVGVVGCWVVGCCVVDWATTTPAATIAATATVAIAARVVVFFIRTPGGLQKPGGTRPRSAPEPVQWPCPTFKRAFELLAAIRAAASRCVHRYAHPPTKPGSHLEAPTDLAAEPEARVRKPTVAGL